MDMMHDAGLKWCSWESYKDFRLSDHLPYQCYSPFEWKCWTKTYYEKEWYTIYPASDFIENKRKPKQGEYVLVRNHNNDEWLKMIFLLEIPQSRTPFVVVNDIDEKSYFRWEEVRTPEFSYMKQYITSTYTIECTEEQYKKVQDLISK